MRRFVVSVCVAFGLVVIGAGPASAEPVPGTSSAPAAAAGKKMCKVTDDKLDELSGLVATDDGYVVINDSAPTESRKRIFFLDTKCKIVDSKTYSSGPRDTEDMILSPDGKTLWIADIGDNNRERSTVGLWTMPLDGSSKPKLHRVAYPDGAHDAEALLLNGDGTPIIVTKETGKPAGLYSPTGKLEADNTDGVPMKRVGEITVPPSDTSANTLARLLRGSIDGGAVALGGGKVVLRTYTDALEWDVSNGDVLAALKGAPRVTPLPDEPFGEAITYSPDGKYFYTVSDMQGEPENGDNYILRYTPAAKAAAVKNAAATGTDDAGGSFFDSLSINDITYLVGGVGVLGAILVGFGIFGIMRSRKKPLIDAPAKSAGAGPDPTDAETELIGVGGPNAPRGGPGVYGGNRPAGAASGPGVYGAKPAAAPAKAAGVYGAGGGRPAQPARPGPAGQPARPGPAGQPARPGPGGQPVRPGSGGQPARPGPAGQPVRPGPAGQPQRPQGQPARPPQGQPARQPGQPARPQGQPGRPQGQPARAPQGQPPRPPQGGQPGRPAQGQQPPRRPAGGAQPPPSGRPPQGGGGGGVYGAPPSGQPGPRGAAGGQRPPGNGSRGRDFDNPGYRR